MANRLMNFVEKYLIKEYLDAQSDDFEVAKIRLTLDFLLSFLILSLIVIPTPFIAKSTLPFSFNLFFPVPFIICIAILKFGRNYRLSALIFCISLYIMVTVNSIIANGSLLISVAIWYCVLILFSNLIISNRASALFMILILLTVTGIVSLKLQEFQFFNSDYTVKNSLVAVPIVLCFALIVMYRLLTEYARLMQEAVEKIIATNKAKDSILRIVAHDLRNPIGAIRTICHLLQNDISLSSVQSKGQIIPENIDLIDNASNNAMTIIEDLTESAEIEEGKSVLNIEKVELAPILESIIQLNAAQARLKNISLESTYGQQKIYAKIDKRKFSRAFENIISNAIKFTAKDGTVKINLSLRENHARISVSDTGIGIPIDMHNIVYNKFTNARRIGTEGEKTIGLGLSITKDIIQRHKGKIWFESTPDSGTIFYIEIPAYLKAKIGIEQTVTKIVPNL